MRRQDNRDDLAGPDKADSWRYVEQTNGGDLLGLLEQPLLGFGASFEQPVEFEAQESLQVDVE